MEFKKRFNELSVLFPLLVLYTIAYLALMGYDFAAKDSFEMPPGMMGIYIALTLAYATDKEIRRWIGKETPQKKGAFFVYAWLVFYLVVFMISSLKPDYSLPADLNKVALQVLGIFFGSKISKKIFQFKKGKIVLGDSEDLAEEKPEEVPAETLGKYEKTILDFLQKNGRGKRGDFMSALGISKSSVGRVLELMEKKELITQMGEKKASFYILKGKEE